MPKTLTTQYDQAIDTLKQAALAAQDVERRVQQVEKERVARGWDEAQAAYNAWNVGRPLGITVAQIAKDAGRLSASHIGQMIKVIEKFPPSLQIRDYHPEQHYEALKACGDVEGAFARLMEIKREGSNVSSALRPRKDFAGARRVLSDPDLLMECLGSFKTDAEQELVVTNMRLVLIKRKGQLTDPDEALASWTGEASA